MRAKAIAAVLLVAFTLAPIAAFADDSATEVQLQTSSYTQLEQAISNMMKSFADAMSATVANMKN